MIAADGSEVWHGLPGSAIYFEGGSFSGRTGTPSLARRKATMPPAVTLALATHSACQQRVLWLTSRICVAAGTPLTTRLPTGSEPVGAWKRSIALSFCGKKPYYSGCRMSVVCHKLCFPLAGIGLAKACASSKIQQYGPVAKGSQASRWSNRLSIAAVSVMQSTNSTLPRITPRGRFSGMSRPSSANTGTAAP